MKLPVSEPVLPSENESSKIKELSEQISALENKFNEQADYLTRYVQNNVGRIDRDISEVKKSSFQRQMTDINSFAIHFNKLEMDLKEHIDRTDDFFNEIGDIEASEGEISAYNKCLRLLRQSQMTFVTAQAEISEQRMLWNRMIEQLRQEQQ